MVRQSYSGGAPDDPGKREHHIAGHFSPCLQGLGPYVTQHAECAKIGRCHKVRGTTGRRRASLCTPSHSPPLPTLEKKNQGHSKGGRAGPRNAVSDFQAASSLSLMHSQDCIIQDPRATTRAFSPHHDLFDPGHCSESHTNSGSYLPGGRAYSTVTWPLSPWKALVPQVTQVLASQEAEW